MVREVDLGTCENLEDVTLHCYTHLGHLLHAGDVVMGYDLKHATNVVTATVHNDDENEHTSSAAVSSAAELDNSHLIPRLPFDIPDVVLVRKQTSKEAYRAQVKIENAGLNPQKKRNRRVKKSRKAKKEEGFDEQDFDLEQQNQEDGLLSHSNGDNGDNGDMGEYGAEYDSEEEEYRLNEEELVEYLEEGEGDGNADGESEVVDDC